MASTVHTVLGPRPSAEIGFTLIHEHILCTLECYWDAGAAESSYGAGSEPVSLDNLWRVRRHYESSRDNLVIDDTVTAAQELALFAREGGTTIVDLSCRGIGRDPEGLRDLALATGLNIVTSTGYYIASSHPLDVVRRDAVSLAEEMIADLLVGVGDSGIRAGIIGEIGTSSPILREEEKVLRAAIAAQQETGASIVVHPGQDQEDVRDLARLMQSLGCDPTRVIVSHLDERLRDTWSAYESLASEGFHLGLDTFGKNRYYPSRDREYPSDDARIEIVLELSRRGLSSQVLIAQDVCVKAELTRYGGPGYGYIARDIVPRLRRAGLSSSELDQILVRNPRQMLEH